MGSLYISALHKSSGKTILSAGICAALRAGGHSVQAFKKGPDYIDPMWLSVASGRSCYNLDHHTMTEAQLGRSFNVRGVVADMRLVEGNKGLHDGVDPNGADSNAALAKLLNCPVVLIVDASGIMRSIAPMVNGFHHFDPDVDIRGLILNKTGGARHEGKLIAAIEQYCDLPVLGSVERNPNALLDERHIGLTPTAESPTASGLVRKWRDVVRDSIDLTRLVEIGKPVHPTVNARTPKVPSPVEQDMTIGIARGQAFSFYYPDDLEHLALGGARLVDFDPMRDEQLPDCDAVFLGGGFPECHLAALEANRRLRDQLRQKIEQGLPVYAECGGLMYLADSVSASGEMRAMVGAIRGKVKMHARPQGRGYARLCRTPTHPWGDAEDVLPAHEFHHSTISDLSPETRFAYQVERGNGVDGQYDGIVVNNVLAAYTHRRDVSGAGWTREFLAFIRNVKRNRGPRTILGTEVHA